MLLLNLYRPTDAPPTVTPGEAHAAARVALAALADLGARRLRAGAAESALVAVGAYARAAGGGAGETDGVRRLRHFTRLLRRELRDLRVRS